MQIMHNGKSYRENKIVNRSWFASRTRSQQTTAGLEFAEFSTLRHQRRVSTSISVVCLGLPGVPQPSLTVPQRLPSVYQSSVSVVIARLFRRRCHVYGLNSKGLGLYYKGLEVRSFCVLQSTLFIAQIRR
jgi:hypothetical protein